MTNHKPTLIDSVPEECYQTFDFALEWIFNTTIKLMLENKMTKTMNTLIVKLLFKKEDRRCVENYRPLLLASTDYKLIAKVISKRLKPMLT